MKSSTLQKAFFILSLTATNSFAEDNKLFEQANAAIKSGNCDAGIQILSELSSRNVPGALINLGNIYATGSCGEQDFGRADSLYKAAAALDVPIGHYQFGLLHFGDQSYDQDYDLVFKHWSRAFNQGMPIHYELSILYYKGLGTSKNPEKAESLLIEASSLGDEHARDLLNSFYQDKGGPLYKPKQ